MTVDIKVPVLPESVADATIAAWHKQPGEPVKRDETLVDIETDKVVLEVVAPEDGVLDKILKPKGSTVTAQEVIGTFTAQANKAPVEAVKVADVAQSVTKPAEITKPVEPLNVHQTAQPSVTTDIPLSPSVRRAMHENLGSVKSEQVGKTAASSVPAQPFAAQGNRVEQRVPMTRLRARIAERLLAAQHNAAILTTFNEVNMLPIMELRNKYKEDFMQKYGVRLGFMSFFVAAVVAALKRFPVINASIDGDDIVYHGYFDIGIAVSSPRGLVVPIVRNADTLTMDEIERQIAAYGKNAQDGKLAIEDMTGGTFTITNGGVFGSLMATPIINPPQSAILGMHKIEERPVVIDKQIVIRPMMYVALSYDHRLIDGAESVQFLVTVKEMLEEPARLLLSV